MSAEVVWRPHAGPQRAFLADTAYEALYGGAAGGGKSDALLFGALRQIAHPDYRAILLRRTFPELRELMDRALSAFWRLGGTWNVQEKRWTFTSGATFEFGYAKTYEDLQQYQGQQFTYIGWDEVGQIAEERMWTFMISRNRTGSRGLTLQMRGSANPGGRGHAWLKRRFIGACGVDGGTITDGATGLTRSYIPARLRDNPTLLTNDPGYLKRLMALPERTRKQLLDGDWDAGEGMALDELTRDVHLVPAIRVPDRWFQWGAFDWGFRHPYAFGHFAADEDGTVYLVDSVHGRGQLPPQIAAMIAERIPVAKLRMMHAGHDAMHEVRARGEMTPTIAEQMMPLGFLFTPANISRRLGLNNLRQYVTWTRGADGAVKVPPRFRIMDTPGNRRVFDVLESMVTDPDDPEDALKVDADEHGSGGDDAYDMVRYGLAARPLAGKPQEADPITSAWDARVLAKEAERKVITPAPRGTKAATLAHLAARVSARVVPNHKPRRRAPIGGELA